VICATLLPANCNNIADARNPVRILFKGHLGETSIVNILRASVEAEKTLVEASSALPGAADLDVDAEEKEMAVGTNDGMPEASADANHKGKTYMESLICPLCKRQLSDAGTTTPGPRELAGSMPIETLYCASCEMLVAPLASSAPRVSVNASDNRGRIRSGGSNAGGSQRGDSSARFSSSCDGV